MIYARGNAAKQWIFEELDRRFGQSPCRILDLGCGRANLWAGFLAEHPSARVLGIDTDAEAIEVAKRTHQGNVQIELRISDAQSAFSGESFDAVVALSTIEHVVDRPAFLRTVGRALTSGGIAFLNYDVGHFRSRDLKERLMVPISQLLARIGIQGPYMKKVNDAVFREQIQHEGLAVIQMRKHNIGCLKGFMKNASDNAVMDWYEFEERLHARFSLEELDPLMLSTTFVVTKP